MLKPTSFDCLTYDLESEKENEVLFKNISMQYADFFDFLANVTGYEEMNFKKAASLYDIQREVYFSANEIFRNDFKKKNYGQMFIEC